MYARLAPALLVTLGLSSPGEELLALSARAGTPRFEPPLDVDRPALTGAPGDQTAAAAAFDGQRFLVAWRTTLWKPELRVARVTADGQALDPRGVRLDEFERTEGRVAVAAGGGGFLVAWSKEPSRIQAVRVIAGEAPPAAGTTILVGEARSDVTIAGPAVAFHGGGFWVLWSQNGDARAVYGARVAIDGTLVDQVPIRLASGFGNPSVASNGTQTLAAWTLNGSPVEVRATRLAPDGQVAEAGGVPLFTLAGDAAGSSDVAWGAGSFLVAGAGLRAEGGEIRAVRVSPDGRPVGAAAQLAAAAGDGPSVTWNGSRFVVLWSASTREGTRQVPRLAGRLVAEDGSATVLDTGWSTAGVQPVLAHDLALWSEVGWWTEQGQLVDLDLKSVRVTGDGTAAAPRLVAHGPGAEAQPVVAFGGGRLLVAWEDRRQDKQHGDIFAARLGPDGEMLDPDGIAVATGPAAQRAPAVTWDGASFVVAWHQGGEGLGRARVSGEGTVVAREILAGTGGRSLLSEPALCSDGDGALLVWGARGAAGPTELRGRRGDGPSFLLAETADDESEPVVRVGCQAQAALVVWTGKPTAGGEVSLQAAHLGRGRTAFTEPGVQVLEPKEGDEWAGVASDGQDFLVTWRNFDSLGRRRVVGARIDGAGRRLDDKPFPIGNSNSGHRVSAVWDGHQYLVFAVHTQNDNPFELRARRVSRQGQGLDDDWLPVAYLAREWSDSGNGSDGVMVAPGRAFVTYDQFADDDATGNVRVRGVFVSSPAPEVDAGAPDGGADAGPAPAGGRGCSCRTAGGSAPAPVMILVAAWCVVRRLSARTARRG
jgi:hypothetical protein